MTLPPERGLLHRMANFQTVVGLLVTAGIIWLGFSRIDLSQTIAAFAVVRVGYVLAGGALVVAVIAILAVRWWVLLPTSPNVPIRLVFCYLMIGYMVNAITPLRLGDLARAYLLGRRHGIAVSMTLSTVVAERLFDVLAIVVIGFLVSTVLDLPPAVEVGLRTFAVLGIAGASLLYGLSFWGGGMDRFARRKFEASGRLRWLSAMLQRLDYFCQALIVLHDGKRLVAASALTFAGWSVLSASLSMFVFAFGLKVPYLAGSLMMVATSLGASIPSAPGSTGVFHVMTVLALSVWSVPTEEAVAVGVVAHGVTIALHIVLGALCAWLAGIRLSSLREIDLPQAGVGRSRTA
jgi:glycosyltransferase 2 family protein